MQSSSARLACAAAITALALVYFPILLTPDALAQTVLPLPVLAPAPIQTPSTSTTTTVEAVTKTFAASTSSGERLVIPSIGLDDRIVPVGTDSTGAMAVPNGKTNEVGWYDGGPQPGEVGSAVLDAHVFAAFSKLNKVKAGDSIYVRESGTELHFVVTAVKTYTLADLTPQDLFVQTSDRDLNLITCAGELTPDHSTYTERLVVYATLAN